MPFDLDLTASEPGASPTAERQPVSLTASQRATLVAGCLALPAALVLLAAVGTVFADLAGDRLPLLRALVGVMVLVSLLSTINRLRDLALGVALVRVDTVELVSTGHQRNYGTFTALGRLRLMGQTHVDGVRGSRYRVHYSPHSRLAWKLEGVKYQGT